MIVIDTSVLSAAFRRRTRASVEAKPVELLRRFIIENRPLVVPGIVAQEVLSGVRTHGEFRRLHELLDGFPRHLASDDDHVTAAEIANSCRERGLIIGAVDALIAAITIRLDGWLLTLDDDFATMTPHCALRLYPAT